MCSDGSVSFGGYIHIYKYMVSMGMGGGSVVRTEEGEEHVGEEDDEGHAAQRREEGVCGYLICGV